MRISFGSASAVAMLCCAGLLVAGARTPDVTAGEVADYLSKKAGVRVLMSSPVRGEPARMPRPDEVVTAETVEGFITYLVQNLPEGAKWVKLYLPEPPKGKEWTGDDVIAYALAQANLYSPVGAPRTDGKVEVLSQLLPAEKAKAVIDALNLKPVYIITLGRGNFTGVWAATFGELTLKQTGNRVTGHYTTNQGEIQGTVSGETLRFRWIEHGTKTSGTGVWTLAKDGNSFKGLWINQGERESQAKEWSGNRLR